MKILERKPPASAKPTGYNARRSITASAVRINLRDREEMQDLSAQAAAQQAWQDKAWRHLESIGEVSFAYGLVANVMSRIRLYPAVVIDPSSAPVPLTDGTTVKRPEGENSISKNDKGISADKAIEARDLWTKAIKGADIPGIMRSFSFNVNVPGECYLAFLDGRWQLKSTSELRVDTTGIPKYRRTRSGIPKDLPKDTPIGRIWREHPQWSMEPWSAMKALAADCDELLLLSRVVRSNSRARLNAGVLYVPDEIVVASQNLTDEPEEIEDEDIRFEKEFAEAMIGPVEDEDNANTVHPLLLRGPAGLGKEIVHILMERKTDQFLVERAVGTLERILSGLDVPKDIVTGLANVKYSNAIQIDESLYKAHVEPLALVIADAFTDIIYRPLLLAAGWSRDDADRIVAWYDPSEVTVRPDRAEDAKNLYDAKELSGAALRAAYGYAETDRPSEEELALRMVRDNPPPAEVLMIMIQKAFPTVLKSLHTAQAAETELPEELRQTLTGTEMPNTDAALEPTIPGGE